ncbi:MAG: hypothetical protein WBL28_11345 [Methylotenera sp.]
MSDSNVFNLPIYGKPIELDDQGVYYAKNKKTGAVNNVFHLVYEENEWYLYQLKNTSKSGEMGWVILADNGDYPLKSVATEEIRHHFDKPEYAEPKGAWQLMRNSRYGFGKFTSIHTEDEIKYAMILFSSAEVPGIPKMLVPLLIQKAEDEILQSLAELD